MTCKQHVYETFENIISGMKKNCLPIIPLWKTKNKLKSSFQTQLSQLLSVPGCIKEILGIKTAFITEIGHASKCYYR